MARIRGSDNTDGAEQSVSCNLMDLKIYARLHVRMFERESRSTFARTILSNACR